MKDAFEFFSNTVTARSALSNVIVTEESENFGSHPLVSRFMNSVFLVNKPVPTNGKTFDIIALVLKYTESLFI